MRRKHLLTFSFLKLYVTDTDLLIKTKLWMQIDILMTIVSLVFAILITLLTLQV